MPLCEEDFNLGMVPVMITGVELMWATISGVLSTWLLLAGR